MVEPGCGFAPKASARAICLWPTSNRFQRRRAGRHKFWGASAELQMPFWFLPKEVGLKARSYADAGSLWDYKGPTSWAATGESTLAMPTCAMQFTDTNTIAVRSAWA